MVVTAPTTTPDSCVFSSCPCPTMKTSSRRRIASKKMNDSLSETSSNTTKKSKPSTSGRKGDPRMHKAVATRLGDSRLSLLDALKIGGFDYTDDVPDATDSDGVTLAQRKNQLSRRLRLSGKKRNLDVLADDPSLSLDTATSSISPKAAVRAKNHPSFNSRSKQQQKGGVSPDVTSSAITCLNEIAHNAGLSLDQLAEHLSQHPEFIRPTEDPAATALAVYQFEVGVLRTRALLAAGYPPAMANDPTSDAYRALVQEAWRAETPSASLENNQPDLHCNDEHHHHGHSHEHAHQDTNDTTSENTNTFQEPTTPGDRHLHRLEGKCGHQPILHHPTDGTAPHIDFVVGDRVECYQNTPGVKHPEEIRVWPSRYTCEDLSCKESCAAKQEPSHFSDRLNEGDCMKADPPKIYNLDDLDLTGDEWNIDFGNDSSLLGLFKLGGTSATPSVNGSEV